MGHRSLGTDLALGSTLSKKGGLDMFEPSIWWSPDERQKVINELTGIVKKRASAGKAIPGRVVYDWAHRIYLVLNETPAFLQEHREQILHKDLVQS